MGCLFRQTLKRFTKMEHNANIPTRFCFVMGNGVIFTQKKYVIYMTCNEFITVMFKRINI